MLLQDTEENNTVVNWVYLGKQLLFRLGFGQLLIQQGFVKFSWVFLNNDKKTYFYKTEQRHKRFFPNYFL